MSCTTRLALGYRYANSNQPMRNTQLLADLLDVLAFRYGISYASNFGHRGFSHSFLFAVVLALSGACAFRYFQASFGRVYADHHRQMLRQDPDLALKVVHAPQSQQPQYRALWGAYGSLREAQDAAGSIPAKIGAGTPIPKSVRELRGDR